MALHIGAYPRAVARAAFLTPHTHKHSLISNFEHPKPSKPTEKIRIRLKQGSKIRVSNTGDSNLDMWKEVGFERIPENSAANDSKEYGGEILKFSKVSKEARDQAADIARAFLNKIDVPSPIEGSGEIGGDGEAPQKGVRSESSRVSHESAGFGNGAPGPDFWSWTPPTEIDLIDEDESPPPLPPRQSLIFLDSSERTRQSLIKVKKMEVSIHEEGKRELDDEFPGNAKEVAYALNNVDSGLSEGVDSNGSRWWKETRIERRPDGVVYRWTLTRGVSADKCREWEKKYWKASDEFGYKELGSEKSGRDGYGNVWHEFWKESMWQDCGLTHLERTADKWGKNGSGDEWQQKWWEKYDASGQAEKWAHKWCRMDRSKLPGEGGAHVWHERWGEKYDGQGSSTKYTEKLAERFEGAGSTKWGDKWNENFDTNGHGVKQGETWWEGKYGERWNCTWGEDHSGSKWVHKYGKTSCGEHWDTRVKQDMQYKSDPHFGYQQCFDHSVQLREVPKPSEWL